MRPIGAKTVFLASMAIVVFTLTSVLGFFRYDRITTLEGRTLFVIGFFSTLFANLFFIFWGLELKSKRYFHLKKGEESAPTEITLVRFGSYRVFLDQIKSVDCFDLSQPVQRGLCVAIFACIGLVCFDNRGLNSLAKAMEQWKRANEKFCPQKGEKVEVKKIEKLGCQLIQRAYELGLTKSLGSCRPESSTSSKDEICHLRQYDEPFLHYSWRLLQNNFKKFAASAVQSEFQLGQNFSLSSKEKLRDQLEDHFQAIADHPRSSHHIWTNLPHPTGGVQVLLEKYLGFNDCLSKYSKMSHKMAILSQSEVLEHVYGQLLFSPSYKSPVGSCKEYQIHWNAPIDSCARLEKEPEIFLREQGVYKQVREVFSRRRLKEKEAKKKKSNVELPPLAHFLSFHCFMQGNEKEKIKKNNFKLMGDTLSFNQSFVPENSEQWIPRSWYFAVADLLSEGFRYGSFSSKENAVRSIEQKALLTQFSETEYLLSKLDVLKNVDVMMESDWLLSQGALMEVYPYYLHLYNMIEVFRRKYRTRWGRL